MHSEPDRLDDDETYERDRKAWNLPRPRTKLTIVTLPEARQDDVPGQATHGWGDAKPAA
jgi:hypothetical protein